MWSLRDALVLLVGGLAGSGFVASLAGQPLPDDLPSRLLEMEYPYVLPQGRLVVHGTGSALPLVGDGRAHVPVHLGAKLGLTRSVQLDAFVRDRFRTDEISTTMPDGTPVVPTDSLDDVRVGAGLRLSLPAPPLDVISASAGLVVPVRGLESPVLELSVGAARRYGGDGAVLAGEVVHRRAAGSDDGPEGGDLQSTAINGLVLTEGAGLFWSFEARYQFNSGEPADAARLTPAVYRAGDLSVGLGVPVVVDSEGTEGGLSLIVSVGVGEGVPE